MPSAIPQYETFQNNTQPMSHQREPVAVVPPNPPDTRKPIYKLLFDSHGQPTHQTSPQPEQSPNHAPATQVSTASTPKMTPTPLLDTVPSSPISRASDAGSSDMTAAADILPSLINSAKRAEDSHDFWKLCSKAKDALPNGARLENLTWRLMHMNLNKERERKERGKSPALSQSSPLSGGKEKGDAMDTGEASAPAPEKHNVWGLPTSHQTADEKLAAGREGAGEGGVSPSLMDGLDMVMMDSPRMEDKEANQASYFGDIPQVYIEWII
ncbi:hypothetical protein HDV00_006278 [Rhizophlyctis rosea]|nr:hypothetical protein HDV00_006278 [Rhizophlyctis rosea]